VTNELSPKTVTRSVKGQKPLGDLGFLWAAEIRVNETGFRGTEGKTFDTFEIAAIGLGCAISRQLSESGAA
jgi:hypothetical protein